MLCCYLQMHSSLTPANQTFGISDCETP